VPGLKAPLIEGERERLCGLDEQLAVDVSTETLRKTCLEPWFSDFALEPTEDRQNFLGKAKHIALEPGADEFVYSITFFEFPTCDSLSSERRQIM
jgi:hypothetical protein